MKTVLLIDDDRSLRNVLAEWLNSRGWKVLEAEDGDLGLTLAFQHRPEVVLCDLLMPRCNGFQVCRTLRENKDRLPNTKIIVTTGSGYTTDRLNAFEAGADEYLVKPIIPKDLAKMLERMTGNGNGPAPAAGMPSGSDSDTPARVKFWGVRGSVPTPGPDTVFYGGNTPCIEVRADGEIIILDAGTGIRPLGLALNAEFHDKPIELTVLITHTHWDHIQGFPFFVPAYNPRNNVRILGFEGARKGLESTLSGQMESPYFPVSMQQMPGNIQIQELKELSFNIGQVRVEAQLVNHPGICTGYRLFTSQGSVSYLPDIELFERLRAQIGKSKAERQYARDQDQKLIRFIQGSDVLILDSQYDAEEYKSHVGWGHSCLEDSVALALNAEVKRLFLFHHDPTHNDDHVSRLVAHARGLVARDKGTLVVEAAREGLEVVLLAEKAAAVPA
jgi:phosphoribosyl 1,2-cyclic phosphodiesterase/ActR/RegA family two-component response regulator